MTFLEEVKEELNNIRVKKTCCMASEIRAILMFGGVCYDGNVIFGTEDFALAKKFSSYLSKTCKINYPDRLDENAESYKFLIPDEILGELELDAYITIDEAIDIEKELCCMHAFVRGAFLASGSVSNPEKAYRMEIFSENERIVDKVYNILITMGVGVKKTKRKNLYVVYANTSESVQDMLKVTEAPNAVFTVLEAKVVKNKRNNTNRVINCDMANADRASENSCRETQAIKLIEKTIGLDSLKPKLKEAALLRLENEGASINELAKLCDPPLSKSTMNNRLNKLVLIAKELGD
ncbi:MAG: DNA-binding protein WhiA [Clostridia bacterium]